MKSHKKDIAKHGFGMESIKNYRNPIRENIFVKEEVVAGRQWFIQNICLKTQENLR